MFDAFVSYSEKDIHFVKELIRMLEEVSTIFPVLYSLHRILHIMKYCNAQYSLARAESWPKTPITCGVISLIIPY